MNMTGTTFLDWNDIPADGDERVQRRLIPGDGASLKQVIIAPGTIAEQHSHPHEQFVLVVEGTGSLTTPDGTCTLRPGTVIHFAPDVAHSAVFETRTVLIEVNLADR
jgi:quercetin dioxygenase-like cupin family protein